MKKFFAFILALTVLLSISGSVYASNIMDEELTSVPGEFGETESIRLDGTAWTSPLYLEKPVVDCDYVKVSLSVDLKSGICSGNYYLYVKDADGNWHHTAVFKLAAKKIDGKRHAFKLHLDQEETFVAAAIWPADKGMDFSAVFDYRISVPTDCVSEYSEDLSAPLYTAAKKQPPVSATHAHASAYADPWTWAAEHLG